MGKNYLGKILSVAREKFKLQGKVANHSVRKTGISTLLENGVPELFVAQHSGMKSTDSLKSYKRASMAQQRTMSDVLNDTLTEAQVVPVKQSAPPLCPRGTVSDFFQGATFNNCTFNFGQISLPTQSESSETQTKQRRLTVLRADQEESFFDDDIDFFSCIDMF